MSSRKHPVKEGAEPKDIEAMREVVGFEGWRRNEYLP